MNNDVHALHQFTERIPVADIGDIEACTRVMKITLVQEEQRALVVIDAYEFPRRVAAVSQELTDQFRSNGSTSTGNQD